MNSFITSAMSIARIKSILSEKIEDTVISISNTLYTKENLMYDYKSVSLVKCDNDNWKYWVRNTVMDIWGQYTNLDISWEGDLANLFKPADTISTQVLSTYIHQFLQIEHGRCGEIHFIDSAAYFSLSIPNSNAIDGILKSDDSKYLTEQMITEKMLPIKSDSSRRDITAIVVYVYDMDSVMDIVQLNNILKDGLRLRYCGCIS